jgi:hypothetical protein
MYTQQEAAAQTQLNIIMHAVENVAIIGAGYSGITAACYLKKYGINFRILECRSVSGGLWHYDPRVPDTPAFPNDTSQTPNPLTDWTVAPAPEPLLNSRGQPCTDAETEQDWMHYACPPPCYAGLVSNIPNTTGLSISRLQKWPADTPIMPTPREHFVNYIRSLASNGGIDKYISFDTYVESVTKPGGSNKWRVRMRVLNTSVTGRPCYDFKEEWFDAVVAASGGFPKPKTPDIPGLAEWKYQRPESVLHSSQYRVPHIFHDKTVLVMGLSASSNDIVSELGDASKATYQSGRMAVDWEAIKTKIDEGPADDPEVINLRNKGIDALLSMNLFVTAKEALPKNTRRVSEVEEFVVDSDGSVSGTVSLRDGSVLAGVDYVITATGYLKSYPYLTDFESRTVTFEENNVIGPGDVPDGKFVITADGKAAQNLHRDIFYIPDPTLAFVGVPFHCITWAIFDHQAEMIARVFSGQASMPPMEAMRQEYGQRVRGLSSSSARQLNSLAILDLEYLDGLDTWANDGLENKLGVTPMVGMTDEWKEAYYKFIDGALKKLGRPVGKIEGPRGFVKTDVR